MQKLWIEIRSSLWFLPGLLVFGALALAAGLIELDLLLVGKLGQARWQPVLAASPEGARAMLTAIAGSMITVAGVAFSITIVTLSLASTQYTPRILRNFMRDRSNQAVLGVFVGVFAYCLVVLRSIRSGNEDSSFVPVLAIFAGLLLALLSIGCLIFFIHHVAASIQASYILDSISAETLSVIDKVFPEEINENSDAEESADMPMSATWHPVSANASGYIQAVDDNGLAALAKDAGCALRLERIPGDFVVDGAPLISLAQAPDDTLAKKLRSLFAIGNFRTVQQDPGFGIRQIVDIALKALSPGVNDTSTAVACLDYLSVLLSRIANRSLAPIFLGANKRIRIGAQVPRFADYAAKSFDEIRLSTHGNVTITLQMLCALQRVAGVTRSADRRRALMEQARVIVDSADASVTSAYDRERINDAIVRVRPAFRAGVADLPALSITLRQAQPLA